MTSPNQPGQQPRPPAPEVFAFNITPGFAKALAAFQADLPKIDKNKLVEIETEGNKDDYDYSYATLDHVSEIVLPRLAGHGMSFTAYPGTGSGGSLSLRYFLLHESGGYIGTEWPISSDAKGMRRVQNLGGLITYIRRYALTSATGVAPEMDDDDLRNAVKSETADADPTTARRARSQAARTEQAAANTERTRRRVSGERAPDDVPPADDAPPNPDGPITSGEQRKLFAQFRSVGLALQDQRSERLRVASDLMGRQLTTVNDLTSRQAGELSDVLAAVIGAADTVEGRQEALEAACEAARAAHAAERGEA